MITPPSVQDRDKLFACAYLATSSLQAAYLLTYPDASAIQTENKAPSYLARSGVRKILDWCERQAPDTDSDAAMLKVCSDLAHDKDLSARERAEMLKTYAQLRKALTPSGNGAAAAGASDLEAFLSKCQPSASQ